MTRLVGRFVIICSILTIILFAGFRLALRNEGTQWELYDRAVREDYAQITQEMELRAAQTGQAGFEINVCAEKACLLVRAAGRDFLIGAPLGAADGLFKLGALSPDMDGVLLTSLGRDNIEGLGSVRDRTLEAGRRNPLSIYGPSGVERVVEGVNAMLEASDADRTLRHSEGLLPFSAAPVVTAPVDADADGQVIFDSGVLQIRAFAVTSGSGGSDTMLYRFDHQDHALIITGCGVTSEALVRAAGSVTPGVVWTLVAPAASSRMLQIRHRAAQDAGMRRFSRFVAAQAESCPSPDELIAMTEQSGASYLFAAPLFPPVRSKMDTKLWSSEFEELQNGFVTLGQRQHSYLLPAD